MFMVALRLGSVLLAWSLFWMQPPITLALSQRADVNSHPKTTAPNTAQSANDAAKPQITSSTLQNPKEEAWQTLQTACEGNKVAERASATQILGLLRNDSRGRKLAEKGLADPKPEVRSAAAAALGEMVARQSIPKLRKALDDKDPSVALAAAHALQVMHDNSS